MRLRGVKVDGQRKGEVIEELYQKLDRIEANLERIVREGCSFAAFNWRSRNDLLVLFYDILRIPPKKTKEGRVTLNRDALEKIAQAYTVARFLVKHLLALRDIKKRIDTLKTEADADGRVRTSYNIAGTNTGRFSSSFSEFGTGGNLQNIEEAMRSVYIADKGMKFANFDTKQGESYLCGAIHWNLFKRGEYLDACETGDIHTFVSKICEPKWPWTGDPNKDKDIAERPYHRHHTLRKMCKSIGHGSNYRGKAVTLNALYHVDVFKIIEFQDKYFKRFKGFPMWHAWVEEQIRSIGYLVSFMGRKREFFGRRDSDDVIREAIAYDPQGSLSDIVNSDMLRVWEAGICQLMMQNHDSILVQYPQEAEDEIIPKIMCLLHHEIPLEHNRTLTIPYGCQTGWNWGKYGKDNPDGLKDYKPGDKRTRTPEVHILDRKLR